MCVDDRGDAVERDVMSYETAPKVDNAAAVKLCEKMNATVECGKCRKKAEITSSCPSLPHVDPHLSSSNQKGAKGNKVNKTHLIA